MATADSQVHVTARPASHWSIGLDELLKDLWQRRPLGPRGSPAADRPSRCEKAGLLIRLPGDRNLDVGLPARATGDFAVGTFDL